METLLPFEGHHVRPWRSERKIKQTHQSQMFALAAGMVTVSVLVIFNVQGMWLGRVASDVEQKQGVCGKEMDWH